MADKTKDADDLMLEALFESEPIADDGFSTRVVRRIRRRMWLRRITLPLAAVIGASIAIPPMVDLLTSLAGVFGSIQVDTGTVATGWIPPVHLIVVGAMLLAAVGLGVRILED